MPLFIHWRLPRAATTGHRSLSTATRWRPVSSTLPDRGDDGAGAGAVGGVERRELRGRRAQHPDRDGTCERGHRRSLALTFRTGGMPLFIHWRLPRAATTGHRSLSTATRWRPVSSNCRIGATMAPALVRSAASSAASYGVGVRNTPIATAPARGVTAALSL